MSKQFLTKSLTFAGRKAVNSGSDNPSRQSLNMGAKLACEDAVNNTDQDINQVAHAGTPVPIWRPDSVDGGRNPPKSGADSDGLLRPGEIGQERDASYVVGLAQVRCSTPWS
jgi:hypothetical protein